MEKIIRIIFLIYPGFELLDLSGPAAVFSHANSLSRKIKYQVLIGSANGGLVNCSFGASLETVRIDTIRFSTSDTVLVVGAEEVALRGAMKDVFLRKSIQHASKSAARYGSVCVGAFLLGKAGLLDAKRAATHWMGNRKLQTVFTNAQIETDALYVNDGRLWTSAGASSGIDMALAMLEQDQGSQLMAQVAKQLVVYAHRPGHQTQFSTTLIAQSAADGRFSDLASWLENQVGRNITVADMAAQANLTERSFYRKFTASMGKTPASYFEDLRLQRAKLFLEAHEAVKVVAEKVGYQSESAFRSAFRRHFGITPGHHNLMHSAPSSKI